MTSVSYTPSDVPYLVLDGIVTHLFRGDDDVVTVSIFTDDADPRDTMGPHEIPRLRVVVNEESRDTLPDGSWSEYDGRGPLSQDDSIQDIVDVLDGTSWGPDTLDKIADILRRAGHSIGEPRS